MPAAEQSPPDRPRRESLDQFGERLRRLRLRQRRQQVVVAELAGITPDYLYQIERGAKLPSLPVLIGLANALDLPVSTLLGEHTAGPARTNRRSAGHDPMPSPGTVPAGDALYVAMTTATVGTDGAAAHDGVQLGDQVRSAWQTWQRSPQRYSKVDRIAPLLVTQVEHRLRTQRADDVAASRRQVAGCASDLYGLLRSFCKRVGRIDLSLLAADRAVRAADLADDPVRIAAAQWNLAHVLLADGQAAGAEDVAMAAEHQLQDAAESAAAALRGALMLVGSLAAVQQGDPWKARARIDQAATIAARTGETNTCWTVFGPANVAVHAASVELMAGHAVDGLHLAEQLDYRVLPSIERRVAFLLDQAEGWRRRQDNAQVLLLLLDAEREAPEDMRYRPLSRNLITHLVKRGRRSVAEQAARLAGRLAMPV